MTLSPVFFTLCGFVLAVVLALLVVVLVALGALQFLIAETGRLR